MYCLTVNTIVYIFIIQLTHRRKEMAEISEKEMKKRKVGRPPGRKQVEHFIMRITPLQKERLREMAQARGMNMSEFAVFLLDLSWKQFKVKK
jgi:hypothetical protein